MDTPVICKYCQGNISSADYFCPLCGKKLKEKPLSTSLKSQILVYLLAVLLPPLGIWPAIKYFRQEDEKSKKIGLTIIILTVIAVVVTVWLTAGLVKTFNQKIGEQMDLYQGL